MNRYYVSRNYRDRFTASSKAKIDAERIVESLGYKRLGLPRSHYRNGIPAWIRRQVSSLAVACKLKRGDILFLQYPSHIDGFINIAKNRGAKIILLIHDLNSVRGKSKEREMRILHAADAIIVHNEKMKQWFDRQGLGDKCVVLGVFDFLDAKLVAEQPTDRYNEIVFAGNLNKSRFLEKLSLKDTFLNLYGIGYHHSTYNTHTIYKGCYLPEHLAENIEGCYGLVWDGDSVETCDGTLGQYLKLISPHKLSFYLSAGLPVIVWSGSAIAQFVATNEVGIIVDSLLSIEDALKSVTPARYTQIRENVLNIARRLDCGDYLTHAVLNAEKLLDS